MRQLLTVYVPRSISTHLGESVSADMHRSLLRNLGIGLVEAAKHTRMEDLKNKWYNIKSKLHMINDDIEITT